MGGNLPKVHRVVSIGGTPASVETRRSRRVTSPIPTLSLVDTDPAELAVDAIVIGVHSVNGDVADGDGGSLLLASGAESIVAAFDGRLTGTLALLGATAALRAVAEGALLGAYRFTGYKTKPQPGRRAPVSAVVVHVPDAAEAAAEAEVARAAAVGP